MTEIRKAIGYKNPEDVDDYQLEIAYKKADYENPIIDTSSENVEKLNRQKIKPVKKVTTIHGVIKEEMDPNIVRDTEVFKRV